MSAKPCDNYNMIMVNYADLWLVHSHIASLLDGARLERRELKSHYQSNPKSSFNLKREVKRETPKSREEAIVCMFYGCADHLDEFYFR
jgi:hypothetical protein